ncbi:MAG: peptide chain release factor 1 [Deltaproteobacteria bacterium]|nr:peptide chain release factor 1 [Deltaproteobacteria bacterium]
MFAKLDDVVRRFDEIETQLADPAVTSSPERMMKLGKERAGMVDVVDSYRRYQVVLRQIEDNRALASDDDADVREMAAEDTARLEAEKENLSARLMILLLPKDPYDDKNIFLEIRAGTGGEEAALFAGDLLRMYLRYAETRGWRNEIMSASETGRGGYKEVIMMIRGDKVYSRLKFESGVHRVQRVPETEAQGRIHTSAVTVAVLPEPDEVDVKLNDSELRIDVYRSSGPGGQSVNTTDSAVRVTHLPTGLVVAIQDEKSQHKNKAKALKILQARLLEREIAMQQAAQAAQRKSQVGSGDRSERIRTYNFPQNRLTDHRINLTLYQLDLIMEGRLDEVIEPIVAHMQAETLRSANDD